MKRTFEENKLMAKNLSVLEPEHIFEQMEHFDELMMVYRSAIREITTKLEVLNDEMSMSENHNPIEFIKSRIKRPMSIMNKLEAMGHEMSVESITKYLNDVAGIRVVCSFVDDVYAVADMLTSQDDITVIKKKDYIKYPKPNGYRSYHLIVEVPVFLSDGKLPVRTEIQIRTVAMDFWASLEHQMKYKKEMAHSAEIGAELRECAETIAKTDNRMMEIRDKIKRYLY